jgi:hypothetical protein
MLVYFDGERFWSEKVGSGVIGKADALRRRLGAHCFFCEASCSRTCLEVRTGV